MVRKAIVILAGMTLAASANIAAALSSFGQRPSSPKEAQWVVTESQSSCVAFQDYDAVPEARLALVAIPGQPVILIAKSVYFGERGRKIVDMDLGKAGLHRAIAHNIEADDGRPTLGIELTPDLLEALSKADMIMLQMGDRAVATILPEGNQEAVAFISECAPRVTDKNGALKK